jgi:hypothetical protein
MDTMCSRQLILYSAPHVMLHVSCSETWIVQDLMDRGNLAAAIRQGALLEEDGVGIRAVSDPGFGS